MIERLVVRNFILVDHLEIEFGAGFNVLSGETGAGKSILVGALSILFGARGDTDLVRSGRDEASVSGEFRVSDNGPVRSWLDERAIAPDEGVVLVRRTIRTTGRGTISIQDTPVTRAELGEFAALQLDLHSQHEHQSLFVEAHHRRILDRFAGLEDQVQRFGETYQQFSEIKGRLSEARAHEAEREREIEMLRFAIEEIEALDPQDGELAELDAERNRLQQFERLAAHVEASNQLFEGTEYAILPLLKRLRQEFEAASRIDAALRGDAERLETAYYEVEDVAQTLASYQEQMGFDAGRLEQIEDRLAALRRLFRKYGDGEREVAEYRDEARRRLGELEGDGASRESLEARLAELERDIGRQAIELNRARRSAADELQQRIRDILSDLAMGQAEFVVATETRTNDAGRLVCGPAGADRVRFLISTNPGEAARPLSRIASGGEISRVMLAIKTVIASVDEVRTLVFDEIDTGVGGNVALSIAAHMQELAGHAQVIAITHLATIAVRADNHMVVEKSSTGKVTSVSVARVDGADREREIARMLAGDTEETHSLDHARALLQRYRRVQHGKNQ